MPDSKAKPFLDKLYFHVYTIGYKNEGESILFMIESDFGIVYSGLIDCYERDGINIASNILEERGVGHIDLICWTHPHMDHSIGYEDIFNKYVNEKTKIIYPANLLSINDKDVSEGCVQTLDKIRDIIGSRKIRKATVKTISDNKRVENINFGVGQPDSNANFLFEIWSLAPISDIVEKRDLLQKVASVNDYSIALNITFGDKIFLFGGDIQDFSIKKVDHFGIPTKVDYLKIPHHGSKGSLDIINWIKNHGVGIACTTEFKTCRLPDESALDEYRNYSDSLYSTHIGQGDYGYLYTMYDVIDDNFYVKTEGRMKEI